MMRYSLSVGNVRHVIVGNFDELSLPVLQRLFKFGGHHDYKHEALQISQGGQVALRGWQCREFLEDYEAPRDENVSRGDNNIIAALANSLDTEFRLHVFEDYEEKIVLQDALDELELDSDNLRDALNNATDAVRKAYNEFFTHNGLKQLLKEKINKAP